MHQPQSSPRATWREGLTKRKSKRGHGQIDFEEYAHRIENEPLPASSGAGVDGHLLMRWDEWAQSLWERYGSILLRRERDICEWAEEQGYAAPTPTAVTLLNHVAHRHAMFADQTPGPTFPYPRNQLRVPMSKSGRLDVTIADYNRYAYRLHNKRPTTVLYPTSIALSPFPRTSSIIVTPRRSESPVPMWEAIGGPLVERGIKRFDNNFVVYARNREWAQDTLTDEIVDWLLDIDDVRIMADRESLLCLYLPGWCPTADLDELADLAATFSRAARHAHNPEPAH